MEKNLNNRIKETDVGLLSLTITTNFLNHYSLALGLQMKKLFKDFHIVVKEKTPEDRRKLGFSDYEELDFVVNENTEKNKVKELFEKSDVVITDLNYKKYADYRIKNNLLTFVDSERIFKSTDLIGTILRYIYYWHMYHNYKNTKLLCISAYAAGDYNRIGLFKDRTYKWGYFSEVKNYDIDKLIKHKKKNSILWAGRLIQWKHPEFAIELAKYLKEKGYDFSLTIIGNGEMEDQLLELISKYSLNDEVHMLGSMSPDKVREYMEQSEVYLFTSDRGEGWGVVLNEAMNSGCVCISSYSAGSTPFLADNGKNGYIYKNDDIDELIRKTESIINDCEKKKMIGKEAYKTIKEKWNPEVAANRFYEYICQILNKKNTTEYEDDVLSIAVPIE